MQYRYRIVKDEDGYLVQQKPEGMMGWFFPWTLVAIESSLYKARLFCWFLGLNTQIPEVGLI